MGKYKCGVCGGDLVLTIGSETAVCDHCGQTSQIDPLDAQKYLNTYREAERLTHTGTIDGYTEALTLMNSISFIPQAKEKAEEYEKRLKSLRLMKSQRQSKRVESDKNDGKIGVIILIFAVLFVLAAIGLIVFAVYRLIKGQMSQKELIVTLCIAVAAVVLIIIGKIKS